MPSENTLGSAEFEPGRPTANDCLTERQIDRYLQGFLPVSDMEMVEAHISLCPECLARFEEESSFRRTMAPAARVVEEEGGYTGAAAHPPTQAARRQGLFSAIHRRWGYAAAASVAVFGLLALSPLLRESRSPQSVSLEVVRGEDTQSVAQPDRPLVLRANLAGLDLRQGARLLLVDSSGTVIASQPVSSGHQEAVWQLSSGLPLGGYWVRIVSPTDRAAVLREFALEIR